MMVMMTQISSALSNLREKILRIQVSQQNIVLQIISAFSAILEVILKAL